MKRNGILLFLLLFCSLGYSVNAKEVTVFEVRQAVAMSNDQPKYRDYFLNGGLGKGLRRGMVVTVFRRQSVYDSYQNKSHGNLKVPVGKLRIIHSQKGLSVARQYSLFNRKNLPLLDYESIIVGDHVNSKTAYFPKKRGRSSGKGGAQKSGRKRSESGKTLLSESPKVPGPKNSSLDTAGPI